MKRFYELALCDIGNKYELGFFATKKEALQAKREAKKYYANGNEALEERIAVGIAGYEIIPHEWGMRGIVQALIDCNRWKGQQDGKNHSLR